MSSYVDRMVRAAKLDAQLYEEVEKDTTSMAQSMGVVVISSLMAAIGFGYALSLSQMVLIAVSALFGWFIWAFLTFLIGTKLLPEPQTQSDLPEMLRVIGFSSAPGMLRIFCFITPLSTLIILVTQIWMFAAMIIAVRQALDYKSTGRAVGVCLLGWFVQLLILAFLLTLAGNGSV